jgi:hypothetical protein
VCWNDRDKRWQAAVKAEADDGEIKMMYLGRFVNELGAALAYDQAARELYGDKAKLNLSNLPPQPHGPSSKHTHHATSQYRGKSPGLFALQWNGSHCPFESDCP